MPALRSRDNRHVHKRGGGSLNLDFSVVDCFFGHAGPLRYVFRGWYHGCVRGFIARSPVWLWSHANLPDGLSFVRVPSLAQPASRTANITPRSYAVAGSKFTNESSQNSHRQAYRPGNSARYLRHSWTPVTGRPQGGVTRNSTARATRRNRGRLRPIDGYRER